MSPYAIDYHPTEPNIILPAGISFYTFTTLRYTIDMYQKRSEPVKSLLDFSLFVTFFPHLVAGPIVRPPQLVPQFESPRKASLKQFTDGLLLLTLRLFMKVVLADSMLSSTADSVFESNDLLPALDAWIGVFAFSGQIFLDFAGYSTCAIGVALCLGFVLPQNFNYPYAAIGFSDFWKRWHITLSSWLRDYFYIPLGGNRHGKVKTYFVLMATMLLGGLWHGANWTFVAWEGLHGIYLWIERYLKDKRSAAHIHKEPSDAIEVRRHPWISFFYALLTFMLINITWVFFRADTFGKSWQLLQSIFGLGGDGKALLTTLAILKVSIIIPILVLFHWFMRNTKVLDVAYKLSWFWLGLVWSSLILMLIWAQESGSSFIYFQF